MYSDPYNPENSPEKLKNKERSPEELNPGWDDLANEYGTPEASPDEWAEQMGQMPEFKETPQVYERVEVPPTYGVDAEGDDYNRLMTDFLAKGFWLRAKELTSENMEDAEIETQLEGITKGQETEGGAMKYESMSSSGVSRDTAVEIFENSKRADFGVEELADTVKGIPELSENIEDLLNTTNEIGRLSEEGASVEQLKEKYTTCLQITGSVENSLIKANVPVELSGAILAKTQIIEKKLQEALNKLSENVSEEAVPEENSSRISAEQPQVVVDEQTDIQADIQQIIESTDELQEVV